MQSFGGTANSKLFQNVREKAHLAYVASSNYLRFKNIILINCGIEVDNYDKALGLIKKQIEDMKEGNFEEEDIINAKQVISAMIKSIEDEQDTGITYKFGQEISNTNIQIEEYLDKIERVNRDGIINVAKSVNINTIYFLNGKEE